jgi:osmotically inducible protein OsmC
MPTRTSSAEWRGALRDGKGQFSVGKSFTGSYSFVSRFETGEGTNPEELLGAAHAACFSMALSAGLGAQKITPVAIRTSAAVTLDKVEGGFAITAIALDCEGEVPGLSAADFTRYAEEAKAGCPVSKALAGTKISLTARLKG